MYILVYRDFSLNECGKYILFILIFALITHIYFIIKSFFPKDKNKEEFKWNNISPNIFFFGDIEKLKSEKYLNLVIDEFSLDKEFDSKKINKSLLLMLSNQIVKISEITQSKYTAFKWSIFRLYILVFFYFILFSTLYFNSKYILN